jgi:hypothetical protein
LCLTKPATKISVLNLTNNILIKQLKYVLLSIYAILLLAGILLFDGTGDTGDSIVHYLFARYAPLHPQLFFDHWAKPVFVLLASPFAQYGFVGIKVFNAINTLLTIYFTYHIAVLLNLKNAWVAVVVMMFAPLYYILTLSGLTEPLFALFTAIGIYLCLRRQFLTACILISFLPYVRSEGLIVMSGFALYLILKGKGKNILLLLSGSAVYSLAGYYVHHDLLWVFTKIPYASMHSVYGSGSLLHFVEQLVNVIGVPIYIVFWIGLLSQIYYTLKQKISYEESILITFGFLSFFVAHTLFWYLGIFNSMGLKRVLLCIMPMIAIISVKGFNQIIEVWLTNKIKLRRVIAFIIVAYIVVFPFTPNPSAIQWDKDLRMTGEQKMTQTLADSLTKKAPIPMPLLYNSYCVSMAFNNDLFDPTQKINVSKENIQYLKSGGLIIWESKYCIAESGLELFVIESDSTLEHALTLKGLDNGKEMAYHIYRKK